MRRDLQIVPNKTTSLLRACKAIGAIEEQACTDVVRR